MNLLNDKGMSPALIRAQTLAGEWFEERQVPAYGVRTLREWTLRTLENDPYLRTVEGMTPGHKRLVAVYSRSGVYRSL